MYNQEETNKFNKNELLNIFAIALYIKHTNVEDVYSYISQAESYGCCCFFDKKNCLIKFIV